MDNKESKDRFIEVFASFVIVLALVRCAFPGVAGSDTQETGTTPMVEVEEQKTDALSDMGKTLSGVRNKDYRKVTKHHPIRSVSSYTKCFPDTNATQLVAANKWGVQPVKDRQDAEKRKDELVYIGASPYYHVDPLTQSIPYLVPRAAVLVQDIGQAFFDSLYVKGVPLHKIIITSVLRTEADVRKLRRFNCNATENSCHLYGTTVDICYNRYKTVEDPEGPARRQVRNDTLKYVLSEVLRDMRENDRCYIKYERKQGCFHLTVR